MSFDQSGRVTIAFAGAGARGLAYAEALSGLADQATIVAVAEPRDDRRESFASQFGIASANVFEDWRVLADGPRIADAVVIGLLDDLHAEAAIAFAKQGYHILLEKPIAPTEEECDAIEAAVEAAGVTLAVCHVLRYTPYTKALLKVLDSGDVGEIIGVEHLEPIGHTHFAHSFVRGSWRNEAESSPLLLAKACHDIDWLQAVVPAPVARVSSTGSLRHFRSEARPEGAADRCLECSIESQCAFSAPRLYRQGLKEQGEGTNKSYWTKVMAGDFTSEAVELALADGPYGRCVYACDNDVVDHQVVEIEHEGGALVTFTLSAFTEGANRKTRIFGTKGQIVGDGQHLEVFDFLTEETTRIDTDELGHSAADGHGGGDRGLIEAFVDALKSGAVDEMPSGLRHSLQSHRVVFAAERARRTGNPVTLPS